jgi:hypothetical protein
MLRPYISSGGAEIIFDRIVTGMGDGSRQGAKTPRVSERNFRKDFLLSSPNFAPLRLCERYSEL